MAEEKSVDGLLVIAVGLGHCADNRGLAVSPQRWLKNSGQFGVSVVYEGFGTVSLLRKLVDHVT